MDKPALLFSGQGSQYVGMGKKLYNSHSIVKHVFEEANETLGYDLKNLCFEGDIQELTKTENTQPAILTISVSMFRVLIEEMGMKPLYLAGHSLGELSALTCAEAIHFTDAVKIVRQRGVFMQEAVAAGVGAMSAISGINSDIIERECIRISSEQNLAVISNYNSPGQTVISGHKDAVFEVGEKLKEAGARVIPLKVSAPFHCPLMKPAADRFKTELKNYTFKELQYPVIANISALPYESKENIIVNLSEHLIKPVRWKESIGYLDSQGVNKFVEIGPQTVLKNLAKMNIPSISAYSFDNEEDYIKLKGSLSSNETRITGIKNKPTVVTRCLAIAVCTSNKNWDNDEYQRGVVEPYRRIQKMQEEIENQGKEPTAVQMYEALDMLLSVFITKKTPVDEQIERFEQIFSETGTRRLFDGFKMPVK